MEAQFVWLDEYKVGVEQIDKEHQRLFKIINRLFQFREEERDGQWTCQEGIKYFKSHAVQHFADEEAYMQSIGYPQLERHRRIHNGFREDTLPALEQELERCQYSPESVDHFLAVCAGWLIGHTMIEDRSITGKQAGSWEKLLPTQELSAVKKVIVQLVFDMFRLESQLISEAYGGEKFGKGVYYRLVYGTKQEKKKEEVILVFEEKLLINTVGKLMGLQTGKMDSILLNGMRYIARQFVGRVRENLGIADSGELVEENLLSYEQFQKIFQREKLQISLLFNTGGAGYFAYCAIAPHLPEKKVATPIQADNALIEVEQYLRQQTEAAGKRAKAKILVVDDSMTARLAMKSLLEPDYEVSLAESGVAAIRVMSLNPPDLVLLDYEMPVCDGRQTLEMLRSEQAFAEIPVYFLTGRKDPESMIKVMPLKPEGYLLKYQKAADIKKEIDAFFAKP